MISAFIKKIKNLGQRGFTLIELLVTISIFVIITGFVLFNQSAFNSSILLSNLAYDLALTIRQAQSFGVSGKYINVSTVGIKPIFGVHFEAGAVNGRYLVLFSDIDNSRTLGPRGGSYNGVISSGTFCPNEPECLEKAAIKRGNIISGFCQANDDDTCVSNSDYATNTFLDISFKRPDPDATIVLNRGTLNPIDRVRIELTSTQDPTKGRAVIVNKLGQIYVVK